MVCLDELVSEGLPYRCFKSLLPMAFLSPLLESLNKPLGGYSYGSERLFFCLLLEFMEDLNGRELERYRKENKSAKWFCHFDLTEKTPEHRVFCKVKKTNG